MSILDGTNETEETSYVKKLVEAKGDQWSEPETIAKGKLEADEHIANLTRQLNEMKEDLVKNEYSKTLLETLQAKTKPAGSEGLQMDTPGTQEAATTALTEDGIESLLEKKLKEKEEFNQANSNVTKLEAELSKAYGEKASDVVKQKLIELGMSAEELKQLAAKSPNAALKLVSDDKVKPSIDFSSSTVNTSNLSTGGEQDGAYFRKLRKENPGLYYTPKIQEQMMAARVRLGKDY